jgi:TM2 domain-containing membrane protein YozV
MRADARGGSPMTELPPGMRHQINQSGGLSNDTRVLMLYEANKKTALVAYILWFFLGLFGAHNFYLERTGVAVAQLILSLTLVGMLITIVWVIVDAFLIPGWIRRQNNCWRRSSAPNNIDGIHRNASDRPRQRFQSDCGLIESPA